MWKIVIVNGLSIYLHKLKIAVMKKYFNWVDVIIFSSLIISIIWVSFYKLVWINCTDLLFPNADKWADILYTIITSIIAADLFYIATNYLYKIRLIFKMEKELTFYLDLIDQLTVTIVDKIQISKSSKFYTTESFISDYFDESKRDNVKADFSRTWNSKELILLLGQIINQQVGNLRSINSNYQNLLDYNILKSINDNCNIYSNSLNYLPEKAASDGVLNQYFMVIIHMIGISNKLRDQYTKQ